MNATEMASKAQDLKEQAQDWQETARHQVRRATDVANDYVQQNAWTSIAVATVVGCLIGFFLARTGE
jgi:ElaB/YqjD/DUF883 family membrane-anchored ribosome-binding protein